MNFVPGLGTILIEYNLKVPHFRLDPIHHEKDSQAMGVGKGTILEEKSMTDRLKKRKFDQCWSSLPPQVQEAYTEAMLGRDNRNRDMTD
eukprot:4695906-Amphidinium_carterae.1